MKLRVFDVDYAPNELIKQTPFDAKLLRMLPGDDRPDYWLAELEAPIKWVNAGIRIISHIVVSARLEGTEIGSDFNKLPIGLAFVTDQSQLDEAKLDFNKCKYLAIGTASTV